MKKVTIYDVAREAEVSLATVSRVINGSGLVKEKTKQRVLEVIERLDFKPNEVARGLATSKTTTIAVVFPEETFPHIDDVISGIANTSRLYDYNIMLHAMSDLGDDPVKVLIERLVKSRVDGVIIFGDRFDYQAFEQLDRYGISVILVGPTSLKTMNYIDTNIETIVDEQIKAMVKRQKNTILYLDHGNGLINSQLIIDCAKEDGAQIERFKLSDQYSDAYQKLEEKLSDVMPKVIIAEHAKHAFAAVKVLGKMNKRIPEDVEVLSLMDSSYSEMSEPAISSIAVPIYDLGAIAVRLMTKILAKETNSPTDNHQEVVCQLIKRDTTL